MSYPPLHPMAQALLDRQATSGEPPMETLSAQQARAIADVRVLRATFARREGIATREVEAPGPHGPVPIRLYRPEGTAPDVLLPVLVYIHGGGMVVGNRDTVDPHCRWLCAELGCMVASVEYRLAPEHRFPVGTEDALAAVQWLGAQAKALGGDAQRFAISGESSGGTLTASVCMGLRDAGSALQPTLQVLVYPGMDSVLEGEAWERLGEGYFLTRPKMQWFVDHYLTPEQARDPRASPVRAKDFRGLPPALVITAGYDPLVEGGKQYAERLAAAGVPVHYHCFEEWPHGYFYWAESSAAQETMRMFVDAVRASWQ